MDLALLTGQCPADVLKLKRTDIRDDALWVIQNKTGKRMGIEITGKLESTTKRIDERPHKAISEFLIQDETEQPLTQGALRSRFDNARTLAKWIFSFGISGPRSQQIPATWRTRRSYRDTRIGR